MAVDLLPAPLSVRHSRKGFQAYSRALGLLARTELEHHHLETTFGQETEALDETE